MSRVQRQQRRWKVEGSHGLRRAYDKHMRRFDKRFASRSNMLISFDWGLARYHKGSGLIHKGRKGKA